MWQVRLHPEGTWQVLTPGRTQACARRTNREEAVADACRLASEEVGGEVTLWTANGEVESRRRVPAAPSSRRPGLQAS